MSQNLEDEAATLPLELALIRWAVVCERWHHIANGFPSLQGFLCGWFCRACGSKPPVEVTLYRDSFNVGWKQAHDQVVIESRKRLARKPGQLTD